MGVFTTKCQKGYVALFTNIGQNPFQLWDVHIKDGFINRVLDPELKTMVTDIRGTNISTSYIISPKNNDSLGITLPYLMMTVKNLKKYFSFEITIRDLTGFKRRFRVANFQSCTKVDIANTVMPLVLADGWNQIQFNISSFTQKAYKTGFAEVVSLKINANIRIRKIYFAERLVPENELPKQYRLFYPIGRNKKPQGQGTSQIQEKPIETIAPKVSVEDVKKDLGGGEVKEEPGTETAKEAEPAVESTAATEEGVASEKAEGEQATAPESKEGVATEGESAAAPEGKEGATTEGEDAAAPENEKGTATEGEGDAATVAEEGAPEGEGGTAPADEGGAAAEGGEDAPAVDQAESANPESEQAPAEGNPEEATAG